VRALGPEARAALPPVAAVFLAALLLPACGPPREAAQPRTLRLAVRADVTGFFPNPPIVNEGYTQDINWNVFEGLSGFDGHYRLVPAVARRWRTPDPRTYVFELREGQRFSDGSPVTAADVAASLEAHLSRQWVFRDFLQAIESVRAEGELRVVVRTREPYLLLLFKLPWGMILPRAALSADPVPPIGTGPYRLESWEPGHGFVLRRNAHYRGPAPAFESARFLVEPEAERRLALLRQGHVDVVDHVPLERLAELERDPAVRVHAGAGNRVLVLGLRLDRAPFSDRRVREALDLALDRDELIARALHGRGLPASQIVPQSIAGYDPALAVRRPDRARARALLAEAGLPRGLALRLDGPDNRYVNDRQILEEVARQLEEVGVRVEVRARDKREYFRLRYEGAFTFFLIGWACQTGEAGEALDPLFHSPRPGLGSENTFGLADAELDRLIDAANSSDNLADRLALIRRAMARIAELRPILPLVVQPEAVAVSRSIRWDPPPNYAFRLESLRPEP
jgi:peptide/nickel transport system substrate-binding protein